MVERLDMQVSEAAEVAVLEGTAAAVGKAAAVVLVVRAAVRAEGNLVAVGRVAVEKVVAVKEASDRVEGWAEEMAAAGKVGARAVGTAAAGMAEATLAKSLAGEGAPAEVGKEEVPVVVEETAG